MDKSALYNLSYGVYLVAAKDGDRNVGCVVNSVIQVSSQPVTLAISINKDNYTNPCLLKEGKFTVSALCEQADGAVIGTFGFRSSRDTDKFAQVAHTFTEDGLPVVTAGACCWFACKVIGTLDAFTHTIVLAEVTEAENLNREPPMTYAYYHKVIKGKTPKNAPSYIAEEPPQQKEAYVCAVCGYVYPGEIEEFEALPESYTCPVCGMPKSVFERKLT